MLYKATLIPLLATALAAAAAASVAPEFDDGAGYLARFPTPEQLASDALVVAGPAGAAEVAKRGIKVREPVIVPLGAEQEGPGRNGSVIRARRFVWSALDRNRARFMLYPFNFTYLPATPAAAYFPDGAFVSTLDADEMPDQYAPQYFRYIASRTDIDLARAQAVYDSSVAVFQFTKTVFDEQTQTSSLVDLTFEGDYYCNVFHEWLSPKNKRCWRGIAELDDDIAKNPASHESTSIVYLNSSDLSAGALKAASGQYRFGMLIIPDVDETAIDNISAVLKGLAPTIRDFVAAGGTLMTSGKSALFLPVLGLSSATVFDTQHTIRFPKSPYVSSTGCSDDFYAETLGKYGQRDEFYHRAMCFSVPHTGPVATTALLSGAIADKLDSDMRVFSWFVTSDPNRRIMAFDIDGVSTELPRAADARGYPAVIFKRHGGGNVLSVLANPSFSFSTAQWVYNAFLLANSRSLALDNEVTGGVNRTVPALETVRLKTALTLTNYFTESLPSIKVTVWYRTGVHVRTLGACTERLDSAVPKPPLDSLNTSRAFDCSLDSLPGLTPQSWTFEINIYDVLVTQDKKNVLVMWPRVEYVDSRGVSQVIEYPVEIEAAMAALLRADMNIDPSSTYPLPAYGQYVDNVMNCENKEETPATEVQQISIVPLVSPAFDADDQVRLAHYVEFDPEYYHKATNKLGEYTYPFPNKEPAKEFDYIDFQLLANRSGMLAASWDEAVKVFRMPRYTIDGAGPMMNIKTDSIYNSNYQTNNEDDRFLLKQVNFVNSDAYYEHATQRMMAFLDVWTPGAARTFYKGTIPEDQRSVTYADRGKKRLFFIRNDIFFWTKYPLPNGLTDTDTLVTIDKYDKNGQCGPQSRDLSVTTVPGHFGIQYPDGILPREWPNEMLRNCNKAAKRVNPLGGDTVFELTHMVMPVGDSDIKDPRDIAGFDAAGHYQNYPEVQFEFLYQAMFDVAPGGTRKGGELVFEFASAPWSNPTKAVTDGNVTFAADQIAILKTWMEGDKKLHVRFKRGNMPNEAYGKPSHLKMHLEGTSFTAAEVTAQMSTYALTYDVSSPETGCEDYNDAVSSGFTVTFKPIAAFRIPALRMKFQLSPKLNESSLRAYEFKEPFNGAWSTVTHIGTSSIPFREYLTTGTSQIIPAAPETGRVEWKDMWGRHWSQPVRSTIFEYVPIPPPLRNFVMTTTFEILGSDGKRMMDWPSDTNATVRVQMKLLNNYPKWFEITNCKANEVQELCSNGLPCDVARVFDVDFKRYTRPNQQGKHQWYTIGHNASYGSCFRDPEVWLSGQHLDSAARATVQTAELCAATLGDSNPQCERLFGMPTVSRRKDGTTGTWNYAKQVEDHWPQNYIKDNMWDLTHYDYDDTRFDKAYKYHMDNSLPHLGNWIQKPENIIAFPLFKGLGYRMVYSNTLSHPKFPNKMGWWSNNLQSRDHTVVAGQSKSNDVSVGQASLLDELEWVDTSKMDDAQSFAPAALKNLYTCLFNRRRPALDPNNPRTAFLKNVYENNVVPIPPNIASSDLTNFDCSKTTGYTPDTISQFPNIVYTDSPRDWLYFAANLRGNAKEDINVLYTLSPLPIKSLAFEGVAKIQDGGRFVYWNPANSRNSFLVVDNAVSTVLAIRNDIEVHQEIIPSYATTFDALLFHHITIADPPEKNRQWPLPIYIKHHGYGDFAVSVYVGQDGTSAQLDLNRVARVKYTFSNNAGFDINLRAAAIESDELPPQAINSMDLLMGFKHSIKVPTKYNFMQLRVPPELRDYVDIKPCKSVTGIAPLFFDFENINVATIRDGWKGDYYYDLLLKPNFPASMRGRMYTIPVALNASYFDCFPGMACDPTKVHDYAIELPPIMFGVPYASSHPRWPGRIFWTSGYATALDVSEVVPRGFSVEGARVVSLDDLDTLRKCLGGGAGTQAKGELQCMDGVWGALAASAANPAVAFEVVNDTSGGSARVRFPGLGNVAPTFPVQVPAVQGPDISEMHILVRTTARQLPSGYPPASFWYGATYKDWMSRPKTDAHSETATVHAKGAWIALGVSSKLCTATGMVLAQQVLRPSDHAYALTSITIRNSGDNVAWNVDVTVNVPEAIAILNANNASLTVDPVTKATRLFYALGAPLTPGAALTYRAIVELNPDTRDGAGPKAKAPLNSRMTISGALGHMDLTASPGERRVTQEIPNPYSIAYSDARRDDTLLALYGVEDGGDVVLTCDTAEVGPLGVRAILWRRRNPADSDSDWETFNLTSVGTLRVDPRECADAVGSTDGSVDFACSASNLDVRRTMAMGTSPTVVAESNVWRYREGESHKLFLLLLIPFIVIPAVAIAAAFLCVRGKRKVPAERLGYGDARTFVPSVPMSPTTPQQASPAVSPPPPRPEPVAAQPQPAAAPPRETLRPTRPAPPPPPTPPAKQPESQAAPPAEAPAAAPQEQPQGPAGWNRTYAGPTYLGPGCKPVNVKSHKDGAY
eukprot:m51a1_g10913 hypothetical protein (2455) ;mRNA; f:71063-79781